MQNCIKLKKKFITSKKKVILIDSMLIKSTKKICAIDIIHQRRFKGESNYNIKNLFSLWFDSIENFHFYPVRIGSLIGLFFFLIVNIVSCKNFQKICISMKITA